MPDITIYSGNITDVKLEPDDSLEGGFSLFIVEGDESTRIFLRPEMVEKVRLAFAKVPPLEMPSEEKKPIDGIRTLG